MPFARYTTRPNPYVQVGPSRLEEGILGDMDPLYPIFTRQDEQDYAKNGIEALGAFLVQWLAHRVLAPAMVAKDFLGGMGRGLWHGSALNDSP
ncbi:hypothetical protein WG66_004400 [Moniliophthora roreri]|nr:hypothetical protein WG66_004400 [Moniliophthora roreri]